jgi:hypothetical protein
MQVRVRHVAGALLVCAAALIAQDWQSATTLNGVDLSGLSPAKTAETLKLLREYECTCGCEMKVAECRV